MLCLWLNSTLAFIESLLFQSETEGSFIELTKEKILEFHIPNLIQIDKQTILDAFEKVRNFEFSPLIEQFDNPPEERKIIDRAVFRTIGYSDKEIEGILPIIYQSMSIELKSWKELMHKKLLKVKEPSSQLHLLGAV